MVAVCLKPLKLKMLCYNISGLKNKLLVPDFFKFILNYDIIILIETFLEKDKEEQFLKFFPNFSIKCIPAIRSNVFGRASGGILCAVKNCLLKFVRFVPLGSRILIEISHRRDSYYIFPIYLNCNNWVLDFNELSTFLNESDFPNIMLLGDFNARIGAFQNPPSMFQLFPTLVASVRASLDKIFNSRGRHLCQLLEDFGLYVFNGLSVSDSSGDHTFISGQGCSVIDYCIAKGKWLEVFEDFEVFPAVFSGHMPIVTTISLENVDSV